jgi:tetratricopeptide (TPR) repeat protein
MAAISPLAQKAIDEARRGDLDSAISFATQAINQNPNDQGLRFFAGMLYSRRGEFEEAAAQLGEALVLDSENPLVRAELIRSLLALGDLDRAKRLLEKPGLPPQESIRLNAIAAAQRGEHERAAELHGQIVRNDPKDFESWGNLGISLLACGNGIGAVHALEQALLLRPGHSSFRDKLAEAHALAGSAENALQEIYSGRGGDSPGITAARLEDLQGRPGKAVEALKRVLESEPTNEAALVALADLQERDNRIDELEITLERIQRHFPSSEKLSLLRARAAFRRREIQMALELVQDAPPAVDPAGRAQLSGQIHDRLGNFEQAFDSFVEMNRVDALSIQRPEEKARDYLTELKERIDTLTLDWVRGWRAVPEPDRHPAFLVGFPRSGTTLLDTLLMNHADIAVSEENPMLTNVSGQIGEFARIAELDAKEIARLRKAYFAEAECHVPECRDRLLVDKFPFGIGAGPLIHRLFPGAPLIFLSRHPCDVVLSCFMTRFQPTELGSAFLSLEATARLYDGMMEFWTKSRALFPLRIHDIRYESLVDDAPAEMRRLADFLGLCWSDDLTDNRAAAGRRSFIKTPSYSQVTEPIYRRAVDRWRNYSEQLRPALPILQPWIQALGYEA